MKQRRARLALTLIILSMFFFYFQTYHLHTWIAGTGTSTTHTTDIGMKVGTCSFSYKVIGFCLSVCLHHNENFWVIFIFCQERFTLGIRVAHLQMIITFGLELSTMIKYKDIFTITWIVYFS